MKCHKSRIYSRTVVPGPVYLMDWPLSALRNGDPKEIIQLCSCWKKVNRTFKRKCKRAALESLGLVKKEMRIIPVIVLIFLKFKNKFTDILRKEKKNKKKKQKNNESQKLMHWLQEVGRCVWCTPTAVIFALLSSLENLPLINSRKIIFSSLKCFFLRFCEYWSLFFLLWSSQTFMEKSRYRATLLCVRPAATALDKGSCFSEKTKKKRIKQTPELLHGE